MSQLPMRAMMMLVLTLAAVSSVLAQADQWETLTMRPGVSLMDLCMLDDGQHGWAVGGLGDLTLVMRTTDGGAGWESIELSLNAFPRGVHFVSDQLGWLSCEDGEIFSSTDGGESWIEQVTGSDEFLAHIHFIDANEGWATGGIGSGSYTVLHTDDGGATWEDQSFGSGCYSCDDLYFTDSLNGWICGMDTAFDRHIHHTDDGGQTWTRQTVPSGEGQVSSITFADPNNGWAVTSSIYDDPPGVIYHTGNGGDDWAIQGYTNCHYNYAIDCLDAQTVAITSYQVLPPGQQKVFITENGGDTWTGRDVPMQSYSFGIQLTGDALRIIGNESQVMVSRDLGLTWAWETIAATWNSLAWSSGSTAWLIAGSDTGTDGISLRTTDGGATWDRDMNAPGGRRVQFLDPLTGWMLWHGNWATAWRTTDGGDNWSGHAIGSGSWTEDIFFSDATHGWACGSGGMIRASTDGGQTWSAQSSGVSVSLPFITFVDSQEGWCAGGYGGGQGKILHTTDGGGSWHQQTPASPHHFYTGHFIDSEEGWLVAVSGWVHHTDDGGESWELLGRVDRDYPGEIFMEDTRNGWLLTNDDRGHIYRTTDGGESWTRDWSAPMNNSRLNDLAAAPGGSLWVCGGNSTLLRYGNAATAAVAAGPGPSPNNLNQVVLVPFGGSPEEDGFIFEAFQGLGYGTNVACADLTGDGISEVLAGPGPGDDAPPRVRAFAGDGRPLDSGAVDFLAYGTPRFGVNVAGGDIDGDGYDEILTGAGPGAVFGPHVRGWNYDGGSLVSMPGVSFMAYGTLKYGVNVAGGDIDGDGYDEILTGAGPGAVFGPHVRGWNYDGDQLAPIAAVSYFAYGTLRWGVNVAAGDVDGDGIDEILTGAGPGAIFGPHVRGWNHDGEAVSPIPAINFLAYGTNRFGVRVSAADLDGDQREEILTAPGPGEMFGAHVRGWRYSGENLQSMPEVNWFAFDPAEVRSGASLAAGRF